MEGGLICGSKKASEMTDIITHNENLHIKELRECIVLFVYLLIKENLYLKSYISGSKIGTNAFIREGICAGGAYTWSNKSVKEKVTLSAGGPIGKGGVGGEIQ